ncbi:MAG: ribosome silencing factor [Oscillospiraceae bacterium]|jgi:ribosome-associated protein|nr:ribosome silencing factor [Oscillospiraceae bacterium]
MTPHELMEEAVRFLDSKKAEDLAVLDIGNLSGIGDYFIIASASNTTLVKTLAEELENRLSAAGMEPRRVEGASSAMWILMDYYDVIIHIFYRETRDFYCLERLWSDAPRLDVQAILGN